MDNSGPYDPTVDYTDAPAIREIGPEGHTIPPWKPINLTRRNFLRGVVCSGIVIGGSSYLFSTTTSARADTRAVERLVTLKVNGKPIVLMRHPTKRSPTPCVTGWVSPVRRLAATTPSVGHAR